MPANPNLDTLDPPSGPSDQNLELASSYPCDDLITHSITDMYKPDIVIEDFKGKIQKVILP